MTKRCLSILLIALILLPGAALAGDTQAMGRYVENTIQLPDELTYIVKLFMSEDERLMIVGVVIKDTAEDVKTYIQDDQGWTETACLQTESGFYDITQRGEETYVLYYYHNSEGEYESIKAGRISDGEMIPLDLDLSGLSPLKLEIAADGTLLIQSDDGIFAYDPKTSEMIERFDVLEGAFTTQGDAFFAVSSANQSVLQYNVATGQLINDMKNAPITGEDVLAYDGQSLYLANTGGIYRITPGGSIWEQLVDGNLTSLCQPSISPRSMVIHDGDVYVSAYDGQGPVLLYYSYDEGVSTLPLYELTVYTLYENDMLTMAVSQFQKQNPDYKVNITVLLDEGAGVTADDAIRALNTELLAGKGPDVLLLDGLPMSGYIEKGVLYDLSKMVSELNDAGELISSLFTPMYQDEKIYTVPTSCKLYAALSNSDEVGEADTLESMIELIEQSSAESPIIWRTRQGYFNIFLPTSYPVWFGADGQLDEAMFKRYLEAVDAIYACAGAEIGESDEGISDDKRNYLWVMEYYDVGGGIMNGQGDYFVDLDLRRVKDGRSLFHPIKISSFNKDMIELTLLNEISGTLAWLPGQADRAYSPSGMLGVNAHSTQIEAAIELVRTALSQDVQDVDTYTGLPVNPKSLDKFVEKDSSISSVGTGGTDPVTGEHYEMHGEWPVRAVRERIAAMLSEAATPYIPNDTLLDMIMNELASYFNGEMDAQTATSLVSAKVRAYLAE